MAQQALYGGSSTRRVTVRDLADAKVDGERWPMLTSYDALTAGLFDAAGIPVLLVGDSASMVVYGHDSTLPVTVDEMVPLVRGGGPRHVARARRRRPALRVLPVLPRAGAGHRRPLRQGGGRRTR